MKIARPGCQYTPLLALGWAILLIIGIVIGLALVMIAALAKAVR